MKPKLKGKQQIGKNLYNENSDRDIITQIYGAKSIIQKIKPVPN